MERGDLIDELEELVYVSDVETYELLYMNKSLQNIMNCRDYLYKKCYRVLQNRETPCEFCTNGILNSGGFYDWKHWNLYLDRCYKLKDKLIQWEGRAARMELAVDITEQEHARQKIQRKLKTEQTLVECIRSLTTASCLEEAIHAVLSGIGEYYQADRAYILELNEERSIGSNTYEWCAPGVKAEIEFNRDIPLFLVPLWKEAIRDIAFVYVQDVAELKDRYPNEYRRMRHQGIRSLMAAPFILEDMGMGFVGIDNPASNEDDTGFLKSVSYFVVSELQKRRFQEALEYQSGHDSLTGVFNRLQHDRDMEIYRKKRQGTMGVAFADINGLKQTNDTMGHEAGDRLIRSVAEKLKENFSQGRVYRMGGDEFLVLCEDVEQEEFGRMVDEVRERLLTDGGSEASVGWAWEQGEIEPERMRRKADKRMYKEKEGRRAPEEPA